MWHRQARNLVHSVSIVQGLTQLVHPSATCPRCKWPPDNVETLSSGVVLTLLHSSDSCLSRPISTVHACFSVSHLLDVLWVPIMMHLSVTVEEEVPEAAAVAVASQPVCASTRDRGSDDPPFLAGHVPESSPQVPTLIARCPAQSPCRLHLLVLPLHLLPSVRLISSHSEGGCLACN